MRGYTYVREFSEACLRRMDGGIPFPYPPEPAEQTARASELGVAATVLTGLAWIVLVLGSAWGVPTRAFAAPSWHTRPPRRPPRPLEPAGPTLVDHPT